MLLTLAKDVDLNTHPGDTAVMVLVTGLVVVFAVLIVLTLIIQLYGGFIHGLNAKKKAAKPVVAPQASDPAPAAVSAAPAAIPAPVAEEGVPGEVVAAITAAVYTLYGSAAPKVRSIRRAASANGNPRSAWGAAGRADGTRPF